MISKKYCHHYKTCKLIVSLSCRKHTDNVGWKKLIMTNVVREKSRSDNCMVDKSKILKQKSNKKSD